MNMIIAHLQNFKSFFISQASDLGKVENKNNKKIRKNIPQFKTLNHYIFSH